MPWGSLILRKLTGKLPLFWAVLTGLMLFSSFAPLASYQAAFFALVPLLLACRGKSPASCFRLGWLAGSVLDRIDMLAALRNLSRHDSAGRVLRGLRRVVLHGV